MSYDFGGVYSYEDDAVRGMGVEAGETTRLFFGAENRESLQQALRYNCYIETGMIIGRQSDQELLVIMRRVLEDTGLIHGQPVTEAIKRLNEATLRIAVPEVVGAVNEHQRYMRDIQQPVPIPLEHAQNVSRRGTGSLEFPGII